MKGEVYAQDKDELNIRVNTLSPLLPQSSVQKVGCGNREA